MKYSHKVAWNLDNCRRIDAANGDRKWADAINKEMPNVKVAIEILEKDQSIPIGWKLSRGHLVFDVTMDFT